MSDAPSPVPPLHPLEAEVMGAVWDRGETTVREVGEALDEAMPKARAYTTYMTTLVRLHRKGLLTRRREGKTDFYAPLYTREEYADLRAQAEVEALVDAFGDAALSHFARQIAELDPSRRAALERAGRDR
jgi:predicted transcriptional regulator